MIPVLQLLSAGGLASIATALINAFRGKRKEKVDSADVVQGMALALISPFEKRLKEAEQEVDTLRNKIRALNVELDRALSGRRIAEELLRQHDIPVPADSLGQF